MNAEIITLLASLIGDDADEAKMQICVENAVSAIKTHINKKMDTNKEYTEYVCATYPFQAAQLAYYYYKSFDNIYLESMTQGDRSVTFDKDIPDFIKKLLPRYVKPF